MTVKETYGEKSFQVKQEADSDAESTAIENWILRFIKYIKYSK